MLRNDRLKALRQRAGYTHAELAKLLGLGNSMVWRYESGENDPTAEVLTRMAKVFDVTADYLLGLTDDPARHLAFEDLSEMERKSIIAVRQREIVEAVQTFASLTEGNDKPIIPSGEPAIDG